jgi:hypothetical protein
VDTPACLSVAARALRVGRRAKRPRAAAISIGVWCIVRRARRAASLWNTRVSRSPCTRGAPRERLGSADADRRCRPGVTDLFAEPVSDAPPAPPLPLVEVDTDGACKRNPEGPGGWGVVLSSGRHRKELHGGSPSTTNNRMELTAVIEALNALQGPSEVELFTDSEYVPQRHHRVDPQPEKARLDDRRQAAGQEHRPVASAG